MHEFTLYKCAYRENERNKYYPDKVVISSESDLSNAVAYDHVAATYHNNHRGNDRFIHSDCIMLDMDNTHSETPAEWKTLADIAAAFPGVEFYAVESRNHNRVKNGAAARPKYHIYFPINPVNDYKEYKCWKDWVISIFPYFDRNARDSARVFYGVENPQVYRCGGISNENR